MVPKVSTVGSSLILFSRKRLLDARELAREEKLFRLMVSLLVKEVAGGETTPDGVSCSTLLKDLPRLLSKASVS